MLNYLSASQLFFAKPHGKRKYFAPPLTIGNIIIMYENCVGILFPGVIHAPFSIASHPIWGYPSIFKKRCTTCTSKETLNTLRLSNNLSILQKFLKNVVNETEGSLTHENVHWGSIHTIPDSSCTAFLTESEIKISNVHTTSDSVLGIVHTTPLRFNTPLSLLFRGTFHGNYLSLLEN